MSELIKGVLSVIWGIIQPLIPLWLANRMGKMSVRNEALESALEKQRKYAENSANKRPGDAVDKLRNGEF